MTASSANSNETRSTQGRGGRMVACFIGALALVALIDALITQPVILSTLFAGIGRLIDVADGAIFATRDFLVTSGGRWVIWPAATAALGGICLLAKSRFMDTTPQATTSAQKTAAFISLAGTLVLVWLVVCQRETVPEGSITPALFDFPGFGILGLLLVGPMGALVCWSIVLGAASFLFGIVADDGANSETAVSEIHRADGPSLAQLEKIAVATLGVASLERWSDASDPRNTVRVTREDLVRALVASWQVGLGAAGSDSDTLAENAANNIVAKHTGSVFNQAGGAREFPVETLRTLLTQAWQAGRSGQANAE